MLQDEIDRIRLTIEEAMVDAPASALLFKTGRVSLDELMQFLDIGVVPRFRKHARNNTTLLGDAQPLRVAKRFDIDRPGHQSIQQRGRRCSPLKE